MNSPFKQSIKRSISNRVGSFRQTDLSQEYRLRKNSLIQLSAKFESNHLKPLLHLNNKQKTDKKQRLDGSIISVHPLSFVSFKKEDPEEFKSNEQANAFIYMNYDIMDLSYSLISSEINRCTLFILYMILVSIRYLSIFCLVYITIITDTAKWQWVISIALTYLIYFISMVKVSLRPAENKCETILKLAFDSLQANEAVEYFQIIEAMKLLKSIVRAMVPPEFSFLYILSSSQMKRVEIYCMVNYIYASIEAVVYYPFFVIYTSMYFGQTLGKIPEGAYILVMGSIVLAESIFLTVTLYLVWYGCNKRGFGRQGKQTK